MQCALKCAIQCALQSAVAFAQSWYTGGATMQLFGKAADDNGIFTNADKNATVWAEVGQTEIYLNT